MGEVRVHRHPHHLTVDVVELVGLVAERDDLRGANERAAGRQNKTMSDVIAAALVRVLQENSQVQRVEEQDQVLAPEVSQTHLLELPVVHGRRLEGGCRLGDGSGPFGAA